MANSMIYIKKDDITNNKPNVLEQEIYSVKIFHHQPFYSFNISSNTFLLDSKLNSHLSSSIRKVLMLWISYVSVCSGLNLMFLSKKWHSFQSSSLFISILGWGFCGGGKGGAEGRDRLSLPWCGEKKKCEVVVMHIARQWFFILLQKKTNSRRPD